MIYPVHVTEIDFRMMPGFGKIIDSLRHNQAKVEVFIPGDPQVVLQLSVTGIWRHQTITNCLEFEAEAVINGSPETLRGRFDRGYEAADEFFSGTFYFEDDQLKKLFG